MLLQTEKLAIDISLQLKNALDAMASQDGKSMVRRLKQFTNALDPILEQIGRLIVRSDIQVSNAPDQIDVQDGKFAL